MFTINCDRKAALMTVELSGFATAAEAEQYQQQRVAAAEGQGWRGGDYSLLIDATAMLVATQDVVDAYRSISANRVRPARRFAVVLKSQLLRFQAARALAEVAGKAAIFPNRAGAMTWLTQPEQV